MKKLFLVSTVIIAALSMSSCKSQKTLSEAATVAETEEEFEEVAPIQFASQPKQTSSAPVAQTATQPATPVKPAAPDRTEKVFVIESGDSGKLKGFNVIVGSFGTKTNAENQKNKMKGRGYNAFLVRNEAGMFRVVAASYDTREEATKTRDKIRSTYPTENGTCAEAWLLIPQK